MRAWLQAFAKIPQETLAAILADKEKLTSILTYHVVAGKVPAADVIKVRMGDRIEGVNNGSALCPRTALCGCY